jgi:hypothetical protein
MRGYHSTTIASCLRRRPAMALSQSAGNAPVFQVLPIRPIRRNVDLAPSRDSCHTFAKEGISLITEFTSAYSVAFTLNNMHLLGLLHCHSSPVSGGDTNLHGKPEIALPSLCRDSVEIMFPRYSHRSCPCQDSYQL